VVLEGYHDTTVRGGPRSGGYEGRLSKSVFEDREAMFGIYIFIGSRVKKRVFWPLLLTFFVYLHTFKIFSRKTEKSGFFLDIDSL